ncbi:MAG: hypothetical protein JWN96_150, partial [Mycobacterium sp.]|nr:hypothetical protein [Mycobacterium sp.]
RVVSGVSAALLAAVIGLLIIEAVALVVWMAEPRSPAPLSDALRTGAAFWLLGHGGRLHLPAGSAGLIPLGLSAIFAGLTARAGASVARVRLSGPRLHNALVAALSVAIPYGLVAAVVAGAASSGDLEVSPVGAGIGAFVLALFGAGVGALRELPMAVPRPTQWRALIAGVTVAGGVLLSGAALLAAIALVVHLPDAAALAKPAKAGAVGGVGLLAIQASLAPNVITWSAAYLLGPGFAVGAGTVVSPGHTHLGDVPGLPMLAALPSSAAPWPLYVLFAIPIGAGLLGGMAVVRRLPRTPRPASAALLGAGVGVVLAIFVAAAALLSGGPVTGGQLKTVGPSPLPVGLMALLWIGVSSVVGAAGLSFRREQLRRASAGAASAVVGDDPHWGWADRVVSRAGGFARGLTDVRSLARSARRLPGASGRAIADVATTLPLLPGRAFHRLLHGPSSRPHRPRRPVAAPVEPGKVSLVKPPHDPYELFRDSLNEPQDHIDDEFDDPFDEPGDEHVIDLTDDAMADEALEEDAAVVLDVDSEFDQYDDQDDESADDDSSGDPEANPNRRRLQLPTRLRRKPKVIKLPD